MSVCVRVWGDSACFTRPEFKAERVTYDVMTRSAAKGIMDGIYWHDFCQWIIEDLYVCKPGTFGQVRRNEIKNLLNSSGMITAIRNHGELPSIDPAEDRTQRSTIYLKDVEYVIRARLDADLSKVDIHKVWGIIHARLRKGAAYHQPYLGCREHPAFFEEVQGPPDSCPIQLIGKIDLGRMFWGMDWSDVNNPKPLFHHAVMENGHISFPERGQLA